MRLTYLTQVQLHDAQSHPLVFTGARGERIQISVLENDLIRVQMFPDGAPRLDRTWTVVGKEGDVRREGRARDDLSRFTLPTFSKNQSDAGLRIETTQLRVDIALNELALTWSDRQGNTFAADSNEGAYAYDRAGRAIWHFMERRPDEHYYGFGERAGALDKAGARMRMLNLDSLGYDAENTDPLYKHFPFYITFVPDLQIAYGLFYDNLATTTFDMGRELDAYRGRYRYYQVDDGDLDLYFIYGPTIAEVVEKFSALIGRIVLPPRWSLGYLASTMTYTESDDAQERLKEFIALCRQHRIPCDAFHISSGVTMIDDQRHVFHWNRQRIPDPRAMSHEFRRAGMHLALNIKPCLLTTHPRYEEVRALGGFIRQAESDEPHVTTFWGGRGSYIDFTSSAGYEWWKARVRDCVLEQGIEVTWNDNNEYEIWDDEARCAGFGQTTRVALLRPVQTLLMNRASYEAQREFAPHLRPYLISRSGCPGVQRYAQMWSGDNYTSWSTLRYNIPMGLGMSLSGAPNIGHDVGGFFGFKPEPELFVRWVQNGIFHPRFTIHSWHLDGSVNEPWMYPEVLPIIREAIEFRYRLIPYLYTLLFQAAQTGAPIIRPMVYEFPHDERAHTESFDFMLGPYLLVASVLEAGARTRAVYLPRGAEWYDFYSGALYEGGQTITVEAPLERIPLLVRAGGMIPMGKVMPYVGAEPDDVRQAYVFPPRRAGHSTFTLVEDDGVTLDHQRGAVTRVALQVTAYNDALDFAVQARGNFPLAYTHVEFIVPRTETRAVQTRGDVWTDAEGRRHVLVKVEGVE
jgi:alpha-glucosidase